MEGARTEAQDRLMRAVAERVGADAVVEVHLFAPIRQGGVESGVAVVAVDERAAVAAGEPCDPTDAAAGPPAVYHPARYAVYTARYRLTLKGPDRGKWDVDVRAEADAPLLTVDAVVRGVQRRAGEAAESERLDGEQFRALLLTEPEWSPATSRSRSRPT